MEEPLTAMTTAPQPEPAQAEAVEPYVPQPVLGPPSARRQLTFGVASRLRSPVPRVRSKVRPVPHERTSGPRQLPE